LEARPMTGLNWCAAYDVCRALGGRLPTVQERARLEALAYGSRALFRQETNCTAWSRETGNAPWVAECFDEPPHMLGFDRVDGAAGQVLLGVGVLLEPQPVHHLIGNVEEWLADPAEVLSTGALMDGPRWWSTSATEAERIRPRVARGHSLFSPSGQPGSRLLVLEPSVRADDLGVRCARTTLSPYAEPVPYDSGALGKDHAWCSDEPSGLRPVRRMSGELVYRATDVCLDGAATTSADFRRSWGDAFRRLFISDRGGLARRTLVGGELVGLGMARFAIDEQWWRTEPAEVPGDAVRVFDESREVALTWDGEDVEVGAACRLHMADPLTAATDGRVLRRQDFTLGPDDIRFLNPIEDDIRRYACAHLDCADEPEVSPEDCAASCQTWRASVAVLFERVEPFDRAPFCVESVWNPAER